MELVKSESDDIDRSHFSWDSLGGCWSSTGVRRKICVFSPLEPVPAIGPRWYVMIVSPGGIISTTRFDEKTAFDLANKILAA